MVENIQNYASRADYGVEYTRKSMTTADVPIVITQGRMCTLDNLECETGKAGSRASTLICLIESFNISFILSPIVPSRALVSMSRMVLNGQKGNRYFVERYRQIRTYGRKVVIAINAFDESFSKKDASSTVNVTERVRTSEN